MEPQETVKRPQEEAIDPPTETQNGSHSEPALKRMKLDGPPSASQDTAEAAPRPRVKGVAPIKAE
jgi:tRNA-dihydrouridine synthase 3